ncbi:hypothetical protein ABZ471_37625 [Streptomyces sp. NPDC005728]|uniref:hypothetical protein n=1 Tax=Streptomyces sp. NPDC005728 TaxID=3157054 RepID=UPI0033C06112
MTPWEHEDGMRQEPTLSAAEKAEGFAAVMNRLKSHSPDERARLQTQAEEVALGHEAYALGQEYLDRGDYEAARRWLRVAAGHHIPGAAQTLEEIALRQTLDGFADLAALGGAQTAADAVPCQTIPSPPAMRVVDGNHRFKGDQVWDPVMENLYAGMAAAARRQAERITAQAQREADAILAEARRQAENTAAACAEIVLETKQDRKKVAELLAEARQVSERVRSEVAEIDERARRGAREMLAKAQEEALLIIDEAQEGAAQIRSRAQRRVGGPNRADTQLGWDFFYRHMEETLTLAECIRPTVADGMFRDAVDGSARRLPTRPGRRALEKLSRGPLSFTHTIVLVLECENGSGIRHWLRLPQERDSQDGAGPESWSGAWHVLGVAARACDASSTAHEGTSSAAGRFDRLMLYTDGMADMRGSDFGEGLATLCGSAAHPTASIAMAAARRVLAISVMKADGDSDDDAELVDEVGNPAGR